MYTPIKISDTRFVLKPFRRRRLETSTKSTYAKVREKPICSLQGSADSGIVRLDSDVVDKLSWFHLRLLQVGNFKII